MNDDTVEKLRIDKSSPARGRNRTRRARLIAAVLVAFIAAVSGIMMFSPAAKVTLVTVGSVYPSQGLTVLNASGYVVAQRKAAVASKATGRIVSVAVEEGTRVKKGDVIARLEGDDVAAAREQAAADLAVGRANLENARAELKDATSFYQRNRELVEKGFISKLDYDSSDARLRKAEAGVAAAESSLKARAAALKESDVALGYTLIRAPFDAVVLTKNADVGDIVTPIGAAANAKAAVVTIADMSSLLVEVDVSESNISQIATGQPCEIQLDALPEKRFRGTVHMIVPTADRTKASVMVKIRFENTDPRVLPEMSAKVAFLSRQLSQEETAPRIAVSRDAIRTKDGRSYVMKVSGSRVLEAEVTTGAPIGDMVEVTRGVSAGDKVVLAPSPGLKNGSRISILEQ